MKTSFTIGRVKGIAIELNISWFIIFALTTYMLATAYFPQNYPDWAPTLWWLLGALISVLLFVSVLLHELSHSLVSINMGLPVKKITLFIFGGVAQIESEPDEPMKELKIALAGPGMSIFLSVLFLLTANILQWLKTPDFGVVLFSFLAYMNLMLAIFNLVPAYPLDGGRVLRAILWHWRGNLQNATRIASSLGAAFGYTLIFGGVYWVLSGNLINGIWIAFIGWFIAQASQLSYQQTLLEDIFTRIPVREFMTTQVVVVDYYISVRELVDNYFYRYKFMCFPVGDENSILGLVNLDRVKSLPRESWEQTTVGRIAIPLQPDHVVNLDDTVSQAMAKLFRNGVGRVLVMDQQQLVGIVSRTDVLNYMRIRTQLNKND